MSYTNTLVLPLKAQLLRNSITSLMGGNILAKQFIGCSVNILDWFIIR